GRCIGRFTSRDEWRSSPTTISLNHKSYTLGQTFALLSVTQGKSRMHESCEYGSVRGRGAISVPTASMHRRVTSWSRMSQSRHSAYSSCTLSGSAHKLSAYPAPSTPHP